MKEVSRQACPGQRPGGAKNDLSKVEANRKLRFRLAHLLRCSEEMLVCAKAGEWDAVEEMERARRADLNACFACALDGEDSVLIAEAVATLMHINGEIVKRVARARDESARAGQALNKGKAAARIYRTAAGRDGLSPGRDERQPLVGEKIDRDRRRDPG